MPHEQDEKRRNPITITAWIAIALWLVSTVFQVGAIYATNIFKAYVDEGDKEQRKQTENLRLELKEDLKEIKQLIRDSKK